MRVVVGDLRETGAGYILQQCNCVTIHVRGLSAVLAGHFPYANHYATRRRPQGRSARDEPGSFVVCRPPDEAKQPVVVCLMGQWAPGPVGAKWASIFPRPEGAPAETADDRLRWLESALSVFLATLAGGSPLLRVPWGLGCGLAGGQWAAYDALLRRMEERFGVEFEVVKLPDERWCHESTC